MRAVRRPTTLSQRGRVLASRGDNRRPPEVLGLLLDRPVPAARVRDAVDRIVRAHTGLRYRFPDPAGVVAEVVDEPGVAPLVVPGRPAVADAVRFRGAPELRDALYAPFDLATAPLLRTAVVDLDDGRTLVWLAVEHIVFDATSVGLFVADLVPLLAGGTAGGPAGSDFTRFARWEAEWLGSADGRAAERFWTGVWQRVGPFPRLATGRAEGVVSPAGATSIRSTGLDRAALSRARRRAAGEVPVLTLLASAASAALAGLGETGESGAVFQFSRRTTPDTRGMIGYLNNRLLLPLVFRPGRAFDDVVAEVDGSVTAVLAHGAMPFERMAGLLYGPDVGRPTSPPVPYLYLNAIPRLSSPQADGLGSALVWPEQSGVEVRNDPGDVSRLTLQIAEITRDEPVFSILHNAAVFDDRVVERLDDRVAGLLQRREG